jgi:hypothetical protein
MTTMLPPSVLMIRCVPISAVVVEVTSFCALPAETPAVDA